MDSSFSQGLIIRMKFAKNFKGKLSEIIDLKGPSGNVWHDRLFKIGCNVFIKDGWKEFIEVHHIKEDDLLVFQFERNSCFKVLVFDESGCEKVETYFTKLSKDFPIRKYHHVNQDTEETSVEIISRMPSDDDPFEPELSVLHKFPKPTHHKRKTIESSRVADICKQEDFELNTCKKTPYSFWYASKRRSITGKEKERAFNAANALHLTNLAFIVVMQPTHVYKRFYMTVPCNFAAKYLGRKRQIIT